MYKTVVKAVDLSALKIDELTYEQFKNNIAWHKEYVEVLETEGYKPEYISFNNDEMISTRYVSTFWAMALKIIYERYLNDDSHIVPDGIAIQVIDPEVSVKIRTNQKWLVQVSYIYKCEVCRNLFDKDCVCIK
jgi:hypothetical protein